MTKLGILQFLCNCFFLLQCNCKSILVKDLAQTWSETTGKTAWLVKQTPKNTVRMQPLFIVQVLLALSWSLQILSFSLHLKDGEAVAEYFTQQTQDKLRLNIVFHTVISQATSEKFWVWWYGCSCIFLLSQRLLSYSQRLSVCEQNNLKSYEQIFLTYLGNVNNRPRKRWSNFGNVLNSGGTFTFQRSKVKGLSSYNLSHNMWLNELLGRSQCSSSAFLVIFVNNFESPWI